MEIKLECTLISTLICASHIMLFPSARSVSALGGASWIITQVRPQTRPSHNSLNSSTVHNNQNVRSGYTTPTEISCLRRSASGPHGGLRLGGVRLGGVKAAPAGDCIKWEGCVEG